MSVRGGAEGGVGVGHPRWVGLGMGIAPIFFWIFSTNGYMQKSTAEITRIVEETVQGLGYEFVDYERLPRGLMRITIDSDAEGGVGVDDCEAVSDQITHLFTVEGIDYERLEVSSPGVERPLKRAAEWRRFIGRPAHVELYEPLKAEGFPEAGRRKLDGIILGIEGDAGNEVISFSFEELNIARTPSQAVKSRQAGKAKKAKAEPVRVSFGINDVDRANLIAELDFKGKQ